MLIIIGALGVYVITHFIILQFSKNWEKRNIYEKIITILAIILIFNILTQI